MPLIISKRQAQRGGTITISRKQYEEFLQYKEGCKAIKTYNPTKAELRMIKQARQDFKRGNYMTLQEVKEKLGFK